MRPLLGRFTVPGDKSISHRYVLMAALAHGRSRIGGLAPGQDVRSTMSCLETLGARITFAGEDGLDVEGRGPDALRAPSVTLDAGNSGTTLRLLAGVLAARPFQSRLTGDASLSRRPMERVAAPLRAMGARVTTVDGHAPVTIDGGALSPLAYVSPVASAQVKSAVLLAGLQTRGRTSVSEPAPTRDHTERALRAFGASVDARPGFAALDGLQPLAAQTLDVPGDPSSAAAWAAAAASVPGSAIEIEGVALNPGRIGFVQALARAGVDITVDARGEQAHEPVGAIRVAFGTPAFFEVLPADVPSIIDELPVLAAMAARRGGMRVTGASELRVKESDRIREIVAGLRAFGAEAEELADGFEIGPATLTPAVVDAHDDHRLAMAFAIAALGAPGTRIDGASVVDVSYPGFLDLLAARTS
ncbi:MAG TPA: 3-phosphoshikimate 1-carboxyvinyltransferase [Vicinamibacterales bacterium]|nr:3-phosphoshikimate 1-carboxyvinyltransferase [Vicinamibacterales bacterium]